MQNELTDREFWSNYWSNYQFEKIPEKTVYKKYISDLKGDSFIEIGGFPGINAAYFYKNICKDVTLLDYYIEPVIVRKFEALNNLPTGTIKCIESDFFNFNSDLRYDIVFSFGFIEHFDDTKDVINRHINLLSEKGSLLIILPNFRGLNGFVQWIFDRKNLRSHNLDSMKINYLKKLMRETGLKTWSVEYTRKPIIWLEPKPGITNAIGRKIIKTISYLIKIFPIKGSLLSPYIIIKAKA